jgi:acetyl esterase/lipase
MTNGSFRDQIRKLGTGINPAIVGECMAIYSRQLDPAVANRVPTARDISYGPDARHRLDIYANEGGSDRPVLLYVHGGGFIAGDKALPGIPFYGNVGAWAADQGFVGVVMTYRLAPDHPWPAGAEDVAMAIRWLRQNIAGYAGSAGRIFVAGQSAGATHVGGYLAMTDLHDAEPPVAGAFLFSGLYDVTVLEKGPLERQYYGEDDSLADRQSSLAGLVASEVPMLFTVAEHDAEMFQKQAARLVESWFAARAAMPRLVYLPDANHMTAALAIGSAENALASEMVAFIERFAGGD